MDNRKMPQAASAGLLRSLNRTVVLDLLRHHSPIARSQIALQLNMSLPTVMRIVEELIDEDLIRYEGSSEASGGRRRPLLEFNSRAYSVVGVDMGGTEMVGMVADLSGNIQHELRVPLPVGSANGLLSLIEQLLSAPRPAGQRVRGIGIGAPGITLHEQGVITWAPSLDWRDFPLKQMLTERFQLPVFVENDANLAALGELEFGVGHGTRNLVCLALGTGVGAGIVIGGGLYRGHQQAAGEVGYFVPSPQYLGRAYTQFGALESLASSTGIIRRAYEHYRQADFADSPPPDSVEAIFAAADAGVGWAKAVFDETVDYLSLALANISAVLNPELIILGGELANSAEGLSEAILRRIEQVIPHVPRIAASNLGRRAVVMGAITLVLSSTTDYYVVRDMGSG
jgi:glucokinase-like ROK family protein